MQKLLSVLVLAVSLSACSNSVHYKKVRTDKGTVECVTVSGDSTFGAGISCNWPKK